LLTSAHSIQPVLLSRSASINAEHSIGMPKSTTSN
jgi:hypothetical protein